MANRPVSCANTYVSQKKLLIPAQEVGCEQLWADKHKNTEAMIAGSKKKFRSRNINLGGLLNFKQVFDNDPRCMTKWKMNDNRLLGNTGSFN